MKFVLTSFIVLFSLNSSIVFAQTKKSKSKTNKVKKKPEYLAKKIVLDSLFNDYYKQYQSDAKEVGEGATVVVKKENGQRTLVIKDYNGQTQSPETIIPSPEDVIEGDLNNDSCNDFIVSVYYNQGSRPRLNIYCYISQDKKLQLHSKYTMHSLGICGNSTDTSGRFFPSKIENGLLIGRTDCYQSGDPGCCPSLEKITYFKFENGLTFLKQELKTNK